MLSEGDEQQNEIAEEDICEVAEEVYPPFPVGGVLPDFTAESVYPNTEFKTIESTQLFKKKWVVMFSYPLDFTFVCPTEIIEFSKQYDRFKAIDCLVVGLSSDSKFAHLAWTSVPVEDGGIGQVKYPLISDLDFTITKMLGWYMPSEGHALRGTAIINPDGMVMYNSLDSPSVGRNIDEVLRLVQAFQFSRKKGQICQAMWQPGDSGITPKGITEKNSSSCCSIV